MEILADADRPGGFLLLMDRIRQSYVDLDEPGYLDFEYMRWISHVVDALPEGPLAATHLGGGAATMVRYISHTRPGSTHIVCEPDTELTELVRSRLPFARNVKVRIRPVDGRAGLRALKDAAADLIVLDAFAGGRVPADLTTAEAAFEAARVLRPTGVFVANVGDGGTLAYTRRFLSALRTAFAHAALITDKGVVSGRRFGNVVLVASAAPLPLTALRRDLAAELFPVQLQAGAELDRWIGGAAALTDADPLRSPPPPEESWRVGVGEWGD